VKHSFIAPKQKNILGAEIKWLLATFVILIIVMLASTLFLNSLTSTSQTELTALVSKQVELTQKQTEMKNELIRLEELAVMRESVSTTNRLRKENVKNFFDLVPNDVVLSLAEFREGTLRLKGQTKSIKQFKNGFERSLKSLFKRSSTQFKKRKKGGYNFTNISIVEVK